jgi:DNA-nicking Smr family endonuclease
MKKGCCRMARNRKYFAHRPFQQLGKLIDKNELPEHITNSNHLVTDSEDTTSPECERQLFQMAMEGVKPLLRNKHSPASPDNDMPYNICVTDSDRDAVRQLERLIHTGEGFIISHTPEYREGLGHNIHPTTARDLHSGRYSIQAHIDLHGHSAQEAEQAFNNFMKTAIRSGKRAVLIIHGRGLSSPRKPILKSKVHGWLSSGPWRKWVLAFTSARACDGGAGATYVLLRQRSLTSRFRKKRRR